MPEEAAENLIEDQNILIARDLSFIAYKIKNPTDQIYTNAMDDLSKKLNNQHLQIIELNKEYDMDGTHPAGCILETNDCIYVAFKGTTLSTKTIQEILHDLDSNLAQSHIRWRPGAPEYTMHQGFYDQYVCARTDLLKTLKDLRWDKPEFKKQVVFCGHSLGGAMASIAALDFASTGRKNLKCVTFGTPKVFSPETALAFNGLVDCKRVIDTKDPAQMYPLLGGYTHAGEQILTNRGHWMAGHSVPDTYDQLKLYTDTPGISKTIGDIASATQERVAVVASETQGKIEKLTMQVGNLSLEAQDRLDRATKTLTSLFTSKSSSASKAKDPRRSDLTRY